MKYLIVGGVAGGASAAARLRRMDESAEIIIFERSGHVSYANCGLPYYIGDVIRERDRLLVQTVSGFRDRFAIDARVHTEVIAIDPVKKMVTARRLNHEETYTESYDKLLLAPGAEPVRPPLPGIGLPGIFTLRHVGDTDRIKSYVEQVRNGRAVIIGGGFIGLEMAENLKHLGMDVEVVEMGEQVMAPLDYPMAALVQGELRKQGIGLHLRTTVTGFEKTERLRVLIQDGPALEADVVILSIGVRPDTRLARAAGLQVGEAGGILVNEFLQTSCPDIYAVGDAIEFPNPLTGRSQPTYLAGPANRQGRMAADNMVLGNRISWKGAINTAIVRLFGCTAGTTGLAAKQLQAAGIPHMVSTTYSGSHAGYYPGAEMMTLQLVFDPGSGKLHGAQVVGGKGVDKRLDLLASVIGQGGSVQDLTQLEHAYAPPFSSAKDPVHIAGFAAENILCGRVKPFYWQEVEGVRRNEWLLDVRSPAEFMEGHIEGAINIPLEQVRERLSELSRDRPVYLYCQIGLRGYLAARILMQRGFTEVYSLSGGYRLWKAVTAERADLHKRTIGEMA